MSHHESPDQYWVRTETGQVMGPLTFVTIEMLAQQGVFGGTCEVSLDGVLFAPVGEMPVIREAFPPAMWDAAAPAAEPDPGAGVAGMELALDADPAGAMRLDFDGPPAAGAPELDLALELDEPRAPATTTLEIDGLDGLVLEPDPAPSAAPPAPLAAPPPPPLAPAFAPPPPAPAAPPPAAAAPPPRPPAQRVHAAPAGERVHAAPAGEPAPRTYDAPAGAAAPKQAPDPVTEGMPLPELIPSGRLVPGTALRLYYLASATRGTGLLTFAPAEGGAFYVFFKKGKPEQVRAEDPRWSLASYLVHRGKLTAEQAIEAEAARGRFGGEVVNALFALGLLDPSEAFALLADHGRSALEKALQLDAGKFEWNPSAPVPNGTMPLGAALALLGSAGRAVDPAAAFRRLGSRIDCPVIRAGDGLAEIGELALNAVEARVVAAFDGTRSLAEIATAAPADAPLVYRLGWFLAEVGFASFAMAVRPRPADAPLLGPAPAPASVGPASNPELDALAAPVPPPGVVAPAGVASTGYTPGPAGYTPGPAPRAPAPLERTPGPAPRAPAPVERTPGPPQPRPASPVSAPARTPGPPSTPGLSATPGFTPGFTGTPGPPSARPPPPSPFAPGPNPLPQGRPLRTPGPFAGETPGPSRAPPPPADAASLRKLLGRVIEQDHFMVLGLTRAATSAQVKQAYLRLAREHHPDTAGAGADPEVRQLKEQITARLNEAYQEIGEDGPRSEYLTGLAAGSRAKQVDLSAILAAEEAFNMAAILVKARKYGDALAELQRAIDLNAEEGEFYAWRGFARFSAAEDKRAVQVEAMEDIRKALKLNERCAVAHLFAARIAQVLGNGTEAARAFRRCLDLDPQNVEAQRELRLLESRAQR